LCVTNFVFDAVSAPKRVRCLGYFNLINGIAIFAGASLGGVLASHLPPIAGWPLGGIFLLSSAGRFLADLALARHFKEVREQVRPVSSTELFFSIAGIRPFVGGPQEPSVLPLGAQVRFG